MFEEGGYVLVYWLVMGDASEIIEYVCMIKKTPDLAVYCTIFIVPLFMK